MVNMSDFDGVPRTPMLNRIRSPRDLRRLTSSDLGELAGEIRRYLVAAVSKTGGHLGPNLGVVELTIALHRIFDSPRDTLIFDTGHQTYVHKLLTGRTDFSQLRHEGGLSGYPSRSESDHDVVENSHASTALSWAHGVAVENQRRGRDRHVVAVIGDGALTGGMAWEALNSIADHVHSNLVIVVNDNGRSYAPTIGGLAHHLDALRTSKHYERALAWGKRTLLKGGKPGEAAFDALHGLKAGVKDMLVPQVMFEDLGLKYVGPVDGHDEVAIEFALTHAKSANRPVIVHVITEKGRGYRPAEDDVADRFHAVGRIHPETGLPVAPSRFGWTAVFADEITAIARQRDDVVAITAAMMRPVGLGPMSEEFPDRVIDVGIAEQHALTTASGMAFAGAHPVVAVYATFLNRAFDQMLMDAALHRAPVTVVLDRAGITGDDGASHNGMWDLAVFSRIPGVRINAPRDEQTLRRALREAIDISDAPTIVRYPKGSLPKVIDVVESHPWGDVLDYDDTAPLLEGGTDTGDAGQQPTRTISIVALGPMATTGCEVARRLTDLGHRVTVIDPRWVIPVNSDLVRAVDGEDLVVTMEDGLVDGGVGDALTRELTRVALERGDAYATPVMTFGVPREFLAHASRESLMHRLGLDADSVTQRIVRWIDTVN